MSGGVGGGEGRDKSQGPCQAMYHFSGQSSIIIRRQRYGSKKKATRREEPVAVEKTTMSTSVVVSSLLVWTPFHEISTIAHVRCYGCQIEVLLTRGLLVTAPTVKNV